MVIRTTDGGNTWAGDTVPGAYHLESIIFPTQQIGYTSGVEGIWKSTDGGSTWFSVKPIQAPDSINFWGNYFYDANNGVLVGMGCGGSRQYFWRTTDGGITWAYSNGNEFDSGLTDAILHATGQGYASSSGKLWHTTDGGYNWSVISTTGSNLWQEEITYFNQSFLVPYAGDNCSGGGNTNGGMRFSTDGGVSWQDRNVSTPMFGAFLLSPTEAWACGYNQAVYNTTDAGRTWQLKNCGTVRGNLDDMWFTAVNQGWLVGEAVYKLAAGTQEISKTMVNFHDVCIFSQQYDTLYLDNFNFNSVSASWQLQGANSNEFNIIQPRNNFILPPCATQMFIIEFAPTSAGVKTADLRIDIPGYPTKIVGLNGRVIKPSAYPSDTLLIIDSIPCGTTHIASVSWKTKTNLYNEYINTYEQYGSNDARLATQLPLKISQLAIKTDFTINPSDTGWHTTRFKFTLSPCNIDTFVTIMFYGISPIINSVEAVEASAECEYSLDLYVPVSNTGNDKLNISKLEILDPSNGFSVSGWKSGYNQPRSLKPQEEDTIIVKYNPVVPGVKNAILRITNNDKTTARGNKNPYDVELTASLLYSRIDTKDTIIDFGKICVGDSIAQEMKIYNSGNLDAIIRTIAINNKAFNFRPKNQVFPIQIEAFDTLAAIVNFKPDYPGNYSDTILISTSPCGELIKIIVKGIGIKTESNISTMLISGTVYNYSKDTANFTISNTGNEAITITNYTFNPALNGWNATIIPSLPQTIDAGEALDFQLILSTQQDSSLISKICFDVDASCPIELCTNINYKSIHPTVDIYPNPLDFGLQTCIPEKQTKKINIVNPTNEPFEIDSIYITPNNAGFSIASLPLLPKFLQVMDSLEIDIEFQPPADGIYKAVFFVVGRLAKYQVELTGEFKQLVINPLSIRTSYGTMERCAGIQSRTFKYYNQGRLADTLDISFSPQTNFYFADKKMLILPVNDSATITISFDPALAPEGTSNFTVILQSTACDYFHTDILLNGTIHVPHITMTPNPVEFPNVWPGDTLIKQLTVQNTSAFDISINNIRFTSNPNSYKIKQTLPATITGNNSLIFDIEFIANKPGKYLDSLYINYSSICNYDTVVLLNSSVSEEIYKINLSIPDYETQPYDNLTIAINLDNPVPKFHPDSLMIELGFDPWLFVPSNAYYISGNGLHKIEAVLQPGYIKLNIPKEFTDTMFLAAGQKINIEGNTYPSSPNYTDLKFLTVDIYTSKVIDLSKDDGSLEINPVCEPTSRIHLILSGKITVYLKKNIISDDNLALMINSTRDASGTISIYSTNGTLIRSKKYNFNRGIIGLDIPLNNIANGTYYLILYTSTGQVFTKKIIILR